MTYQPSALQLQRQAARQRASRRSTLIALASTLGFGTVIAVVVTGAQGFQNVKASFFSWHYAQQAFPTVAHGLLLNLRVLVMAEFFVLRRGLLIAIAIIAIK
jgi:polar amino acid transport system permease protein